MQDSSIKNKLFESLSVGGYLWQDNLTHMESNYALSISQKYGISDLIARILVARGVAAEEAVSFLDPKLRDSLPDPLVLCKMKEFSERFTKAILNKEKIAIFGDYDVDGVCSSSLLAKFLTHFSVPYEIYIPDRLQEGYGPNEDALSFLVSKNCKLIILVDCGSSNLDLLQSFQSADVDIMVIDHHKIQLDVPDSLIVVNPSRADDFSQLNYLCAAGVVFMVLVQSLRLLREKGYNKVDLPNLLIWLDLVALATICDVVPLVGLNRVFVIVGLKIMHRLENKGIAALAKVANIGEPISCYHCGFMLGPRINAGGRLQDALQAVKLLTTHDREEAERISKALDRLNIERQHMQNAMLEQAFEQLHRSETDEPRSSALVFDKDWHIGLVGLLASRIKDKYGVPAIAIALRPDGLAVGSGRSITGFDLGKLIIEAKELGLLEKGGGHAMAAGLSIREEKIPEFRQWFDLQAKKLIPQLLRDRTLKIDGSITASSATLQLVKMIESAGPYGNGHSKPLFLLADHKLSNVIRISNDHLILMVEDSNKRKVKLMAFNSLSDTIRDFLQANEGNYLNFVCSLSINHYQGRDSVVGFLMDVSEA